ncbi:MAG: hypothetical protein KDK62_02555, partial [Chlamydiia bacterium]|nr:hypothetical protein [Chlamydiia bacterium]
WAKLTGYNKRVTVESAIAKWKRLFGQFLRSRGLESQLLEVSLKKSLTKLWLRMVWARGKSLKRSFDYLLLN